MLRVKTCLKFSEIHGVGCFALEDIKKGTVVWEMDPGLDLEIPEQQVRTFPSAIQDFFRIYAYGQVRNGEKTLVLCADHARHMNHSDAPNLLEAGETNAQNIANRDIRAGEELTCDYRLFDSKATEKLNPH